jgi:uncharacterized membrane protein YsdA (DUF1294 family)
MLFALTYLVIFITLSELKIVPSELVVFQIAVSLFAYILYSTDKSRAQRGGWRIKETNLHIITLIGGWPGALLAQQRLRHKSAKKEFIYTMWVMIFLNILATLWLVSPKGMPYLLEAIRLYHSL